MSDDAEALASLLRSSRRGSLLVVTGAGISLASGIPTFRGTDPGAVWTRDVTELGTRRYFEEDPVGSWRWYMARFDKALTAQPNPAHQALVALERWQADQGGGQFLLLTQNVDPLHERAGSVRLAKVHGSADKVRCSREGCRFGAPAGSLLRDDVDLESFRREPALERVPRCPDASCGALLRQHVLWFDEAYHEHDDYQFHRVRQFLRELDLVVCVGTSFSVGITEMVLRAALYLGAPVVAVDPNGVPGVPERLLTCLRTPAEVLLPDVVARLEGA